MSVLMRPTLFPRLFRQANDKLLRYLGGTKHLEFRKLIHTRSIVSSQYNYILDSVDIRRGSGRLGYRLNDPADEVKRLFKSLASDHDDSFLSSDYADALFFSSRLLGRQCHGYLLKSGLVLHQYVKATLVRVYTMLSDVVGAMEVILLSNPPELDTRRYNLILFGFIEKGYLDEALTVLRRKMLAKDIVWSKDTYTVVLGLCARLEDLNLGRQVHNKLLKSDVVECDESVCDALIKMYGKCEEILSARKAFDRCETFPDVDTWNDILAAYLRHESFEEVINLFNDMRREDVVPNELTFRILLPASAELFSVRCGNSLYALVVKIGFKDFKKVQDKLIEMYAMTGHIKAAEKVFLGMTNYIRDTRTWNAMICGYSLHSYGNKALDLFQEMLELGEDDPDDETFVGVLNACGHMGHVEEGFYYYYKLMEHKGVEPGLEHGMCIINMLIKAGQLNEALSFIVSSPSNSDVFAWTAFLRGCHDHGNYDLGIRAAAELIPDDVATKVSKWFGVAQVREVMEIMDTKEECSWCWIEMKDGIIGLSSAQKGDTPNFAELRKNMEVYFFVINDSTNKYDNDTEDVLKEDRKRYHSEEIAVAFANWKTSFGRQINIIKTSGKICGDCHTLMKLHTKGLRYKLITVRDANQFHNFRNGKCSCGDYW